MEIYKLLKIFSIFIFGVSIGSFLNVVIYRMPRGLSIIYPPSTCPNCGKRIKWYDNIPIISYILLKGKCRFCKADISIKYPLVELVSGIFATVLYIRFGLNLDFLFYFYFIASMIALSVIDLEFKIIPDKINFSGIFIGLIFAIKNSLQQQDITPILSALVGAIVGSGFLFLIAYIYLKYRGIEGLGMGDVKLLAFIGVYTGWFGAIFTIFFGSLIGSIVGIIIIKLFKKDAYFEIPFGPFLAAGGTLYLLFGDYIRQLYFGGL